MYNFLKDNIKSIVPSSFLFKNELFFRYFYGVFFIGKKHQCNVCSRELNRFIQTNEKFICSFCGSLSRNRRLLKILEENNDIKGNILHFSPSRNLYRNLKKRKHITYFSTDFEGEFLADYQFNITNIDQPNDKFDLILCYHVLEHISDDLKAISELYRVLKSSGKIYVQTPFKEGDIYEDDSIIQPEDRKQHFGQEDHVRIYSIEGLRQRLVNAGFIVEVLSFKNDSNNHYFGLKSDEVVLKLSK